MLRHILYLFIFLLPFSVQAQAQEAVSFPSEDAVKITGDYYAPSDIVEVKDAFILLFHQAGSSRGEYRDIAPKLTEMGYAALAIDQRSGGAFAGIQNKTAAQVDVGRDFIKALPDLRAAINYVHETYAPKQLVIWGSSYSASLSLVLAGRSDLDIDGVIAFSPGEYFGDALSIAKEAQGIAVPIFITAAQNETEQWHPIFKDIKSEDKTGFRPNRPGKHGSSALLSEDSEEYWQALRTFLEQYF